MYLDGSVVYLKPNLRDRLDLMLFKWNLNVFGVRARIAMRSIELGVKSFNGFDRDIEVSPIVSTNPEFISPT
jgi:hypothetical protein